MYKYHVSLFLQNDKTHECGVVSRILEVSEPLNTEDAIDALEDWCLENHEKSLSEKLGFTPDGVMVLGLTPLKESDEQPEELKKRKTYMEDFFEKFPNAPRDPNGEPRVCPGKIYAWAETAAVDCTIGCVKCWNREMED